MHHLILTSAEGQSTTLTPDADGHYAIPPGLTYVSATVELDVAQGEVSSKKVAALASKVLLGKRRPSLADARILAASVLTQAPDQP